MWKDRVLESIATKDGVEIGRSAYEVSADGATLTATVKETDGRGRPFEQVMAFRSAVGFRAELTEQELPG